MAQVAEPSDKEPAEASGGEVKDEAKGAEGREPPRAEGTLWASIRERYFSIDRRLLGLFRIYFGALMMGDTLRRLPDATFFYSNDGILSTHFALYEPMIRPFLSVYTAFGTATEVKVAFVLSALAHLLYLVGYQTRLMQVVSFVLITSLNTRNTFVENGGTLMMGLLACWTMFLPLGDRFSVDAVRRSLRERRDFTAVGLNERAELGVDRSPRVSLVVLCLVLQVVACYALNAALKTGPTWRHGEAIHWVLWQNRLATTIGGWARELTPEIVLKGLTFLTLWIEAMAPILVLTPVSFKQARVWNFLATTLLHLSIGLTCCVGMFSWVMVALNMLLLPPEALDWVAVRWAKRLVARTVVYNPTDAGLHGLARLLARLDVFQKLRFVDSTHQEALPAKTPRATLAVQGPGGWALGTAGLAEAVRSLPFGSVLAVLVGNPIGQALARWVLRKRGVAVDAWGLEPGRPYTEEGPGYESPEPLAPWREHLRHTLAVVRESLVLVLLVAGVFRVINDNERVKRVVNLPMPAALDTITLPFRLLQAWSMFAPDAPRSDGTLVVDGVTADGRHLDPFTGKEPDFEAALHGPWGMNQFWCDYLLKITFDQNARYRDELKRYLQNWHRVAHRPDSDRLVSYEVYWVTNDSPPPGSKQVSNLQRRLLVSSR